MNFNRRNFLKSASLAGIGAAISKNTFAEDKSKKSDEKNQDSQQGPAMPMRKLGKCDVKVPVLSQGAMFDVTQNQISIIASIRRGITYLDTASGYSGGKSEVGIGTYLENNPEKRKDLFIVTKASGARSPQQIEEKLQESLRRMNTDYIDLYYGVHGLRNPDQLTPELKEWVQSAKDRGLIKYFGFSTHSNMAECLQGAAEHDWIDAIMTSYNFRLMQDSDMQDAVESCYKKGIGLIAMKVMAHGQEIDPDEADKVTRHFLKQGLTQPQAKIKAVLEDKRISSACVRMQNVSEINENVAAVMDNKSLSGYDKNVFSRFALATCNGYCTGCANRCDSAVPDAPYISEVMRYLMYHDSYGDTVRAKQLFRQIPDDAKAKLANRDLSAAEKRCPQNLQINKLVNRAIKKLA